MTSPGSAVFSSDVARVHDPVALAEIELYAELVIAASSWPGPMPRAALDDVLGVTRGGARDDAVVLPDRPLVIDLRDRCSAGAG